MAQNISILEGDVARQFGQINKLKISNQGGGTSLWVPEDEVGTKSLYVSKNGTYYSDGRKTQYRMVRVVIDGKSQWRKVPYLVFDEEEACYGWDEVSVNITNEVKGYDDDGKYKDIAVDDGGFLEESEIDKFPSRIKVTTPPTKTAYIVGEPIDTTGMVVTAYYGDGTEWGVVPSEELTIDPAIALATSDEYSSDDGIVAREYHVSSTEDTGNFRWYTYVNTGSVEVKIGSRLPNPSQPIRVVFTEYNGVPYVAVKSLGGGVYQLNYTTPRFSGGTQVGSGGSFATFCNPDVGSDFHGVFPQSAIDPSYHNIDELTHDDCYVEVIWTSEDYMDLTDKFEITVSGLL